jgi:hypothetical protein
LTFTVLAVSGEASDAGLEPIPDWASAQIETTLARFKAWKGNDEVVVFPMIADLHSETHRNATINGSPEKIDWSDSKNHVYIAQQAAVRFGADFMIDLGDIGIDRYDDYTPSSPEDLYWRLAAQLKLYQNFTTVPAFFCVGNHDHGSDRFFISDRVFGETFNLPTLRRGIPIKTGPNFDYGFYDLSEKKTRVFFLNSSDEAYYGFSRAQLQFLADNLRLPPGWTAVICQHFCVDRSIGVWLKASHIRANRGEIWTAILLSFLHNESGEADNVVWDFTRNNDCRLAGCLTGDSHYDNQGTVKGINFVITQGFGDVLEENMPEGAVNTKFDRAYKTLIDVAAIKPSKREMRIFRIGAGGAERDRNFSF